MIAHLGMTLFPPTGNTGALRGINSIISRHLGNLAFLLWGAGKEGVFFTESEVGIDRKIYFKKQ